MYSCWCILLVQYEIRLVGLKTFSELAATFTSFSNIFCGLGLLTSYIKSMFLFLEKEPNEVKSAK